MSGREPSNPGVSVFHFTSKVSSAKIRKYRQATERGMNPSPPVNKQGPTPSPAPPSTTTSNPALTNGSASTPSQEPPAKKPRLKLNGPRQKPANDADTIAVSRPKRTTAKPGRYSQDLHVSDDDEPEVVEAPPRAASSDLSSLDPSPPASTNEDEPLVEGTPTRSVYGDFFSYYVADNDEPESPPAAAPAPKKATKEPKSKAKAQQKQQKAQKQQPKPREKDDQVAQDTKLDTAPRLEQKQSIEQQQPPPIQQQQQQQQPSKQTQAQQQPPSGLANHQPQPYNPQQPHGPNFHKSTAPRPPPQQMPMQSRMPPQPMQQPLPPPPFPPPEPPVMEHIPIKYYARPSEMVKRVETLSMALTKFGGLPPPTKDKIPIDTLLAMFEGDNDSKDSDSDEEMQDSDDPDRVRAAGEEDSPLTFGIQFIMNALKSWAQQRLYSQRVAAWQQDFIASQNAAPRRGPGRPRKDHASLPSDKHHSTDGHIDLSNTPEGHAVAAFRDVIESGCLQVNVVVPTALGHALRHLYSQIDHLINQHNKNNQPWQCMSYKAQIIAHRMHVDKHKAQAAKMEEELARQQYIAHEQIMQQMGMPHNMGGRYPHPPPPHRHSMPGRNFSQGPQQYYGPSPHGTPAGMGYSPMPNQHSHSGSPAVQSPRSGNPVHDPQHMPKGTGYFPLPDHMSYVNTYMPGYQPRMGMNMKFSFAPSNMAHVEAWGPQAFPAMGSGGPNLPNRGPMNGSPHVGQPSGVPGQAAVLPSRPSSSQRKYLGGVDGHAHPVNTSQAPTGFTPVNRPVSRAAAEPPAAASPSIQPTQQPTTHRTSRSESASERRTLRSSHGSARAAARPSNPNTIILDS